ncbi:MAG: SpaH/EbpB family LPXTG-anchored major pilin [Lachnospiraceae bacterium]|nr:SpaH/EbpB family LPXTG-anchored major pilin [Lachnospiraceae bacterium]
MILAVALMAIFPSMAATEDIIDASRTTSLTIYKYDLTAAQQAGVDVSKYTADGEEDSAAQSALGSYALKGVVFTWLYVSRIETDSSGGSIRIRYDLPAALDTILGLTAEAHTSDEINAALASALSGDKNTATKNALEQYVDSNGGTKMAETDANGRTKSSNMTQGLYLIVETAVPEEVYYTTDPFFVSLPMTDATGDYWVYDVYVYPKNQTNNPTIDKLVSEDGNYADTATASEGDVLDYRIVTKLPSITSESTYLTEYMIEDSISEGIVYNKDASILFYSAETDAKNATGTPEATWGTAGTYYKVSYGTSSMKITMTEAGLKAINPAYSDLYLVVAYSATVSSTASTVLGDSGNPNTADLTYSRSNTTYYNTIEDEANVYSYGIHLTKTFGSDGGDPTDVQFVLQNTTDNYFVTATGSDGVYYVTGQGASEAEATVFSPDSSGSLVINGLEADTYVMTEIQTSDGFSLLKNPLTIVFTQTVDHYIPSAATVTGIANEYEKVTASHNSDASVTVDGSSADMSSDSKSEHARVDISILNSKSFTLPQTGGLGTILFTLGGAIAVIIGAFVISRSKKKAA